MVYLMRKQSIKQEEKAVLLCIPTVSMNPRKRCQSGEYFAKSDERQTDLWAAGIRKRQTHLISLRASDFIQEMGFFVSHWSTSILVRLPRIFPSYRCPHQLDELLRFNLRMFTSC